MFSFLLPKSAPFFEMMKRQSQFFCDVAREAADIFENYDRRFEASKKIAELEFEADKLYRDIIRALSNSFITPIDREDILRIAQMQEECIDKIQSLSTRITTGDVPRIRFPAKKITALVLDMARITGHMLEGLSSRRDVHKTREFRSKREECDSILAVGFAEAMDLPEGGTPADVMLILQWVQVYDRLEALIGKVTDLAETIDEAVLKNV